jgi:hypothetical protein
VGNKRKTYDTAEKLFEFSRKQPIALMIYNNVEYVGVPLDVLIRKYRSEHEASPPYASLAEATDAFLQYLQDFEHDLMEEKRYIYIVLRERLERINARFNQDIRDLLAKYLAEETKELPAAEGILAVLVREAAAVEKAHSLTGYLPKVTLAQFRKRFADAVERAYRDVFKNLELTDEVKKAVHDLGFRLMKSRRESNLLTGLVFGGFAENDMFPTLRSVEIDGVFFGQIKVLSTHEIDIDRKKKRAEVVPFAQKEMVERFIYGLDAEMQGSIQEFVSTAVNDILSFVEETEEEQNVKDDVKRTVNKNFSDMLKNLREKSRQDLLDIVYFMSKKELADIAYALVELTSHKRRFSTDEETVGGPIDVAILTKNEGLVWIKRKHYFEQDINPSYYTRAFRKGGSGDDGEKAVQ